MSQRTKHEARSTDAAVTYYRAHMRHELGWLESWRVMATNVWSARELIWQLFKRDFFAGYKKSFVGTAWIVIMPIAGILQWVFMQHSGLLRSGDVGTPYPVYVLVGTTMWGLFMGSLYAASGTLDAGRELVMQVNYPHEALLFKQLAQQIANSTIAFGIGIVALLCFGIVPAGTTLLVPLAVLPMLCLASAVGLILAMISVVAFDLTRIVNLGLGLAMYLTPIVYTAEGASPLVQAVARWNPLTYLVCSCRDLVLFGRLYDPTGYALCSAVSVLLLLLAWRLFFVSEHQMVERMI